MAQMHLSNDVSLLLRPAYSRWHFETKWAHNISNKSPTRKNNTTKAWQLTSTSPESWISSVLKWWIFAWLPNGLVFKQHLNTKQRSLKFVRFWDESGFQVLWFWVGIVKLSARRIQYAFGYWRCPVTEWPKHVQLNGSLTECHSVNKLKVW